MMNFLMNRFGFGFFGKRTGLAAAAAAAVLMTAAGYQAYKGYKKYKSHERFKEHQKQLKQEQESAFENRYFKEYDELADDPDAPIPPSHSHVRETTPQGDVIMTYDADQVQFCYYCDKRSVQFKYLEPVARKYVVNHGCKRLYIDFRNDLTRAHVKPEPAKPNSNATNTTNATSATKSIFAQFKKYGTNPKPNPTKPKQQPQQPPLAVLKEQVTRYWYCGRLDEFNPQPASETATTPEFSIIKPIDYASYKKLNS